MGDAFTSTVVPNATSNRHSRNLAISYVFFASGSTGVESCAVKFEKGWPIGSSESWRPGTDILSSMMIYLALILYLFVPFFYPFCLFTASSGSNDKAGRDDVMCVGLITVVAGN